MPLVRPAASPPSAAPPVDREVRLGQLSSTHADERRGAARALAGDPAAIDGLATRLAVETEADVRSALFASLVATGGAHAAGVLAHLLQSGDAGLRGGAVSALQGLAEDAVPTLDALLDDPDPDLRLLAIEVTRTWSSALAVPRLARLIERDAHVNVCAAAVDVATEVGTAALLAPLAALRARFAGEAFLGFAIDVACARIRAAGRPA